MPSRPRRAHRAGLLSAGQQPTTAGRNPTRRRSSRRVSGLVAAALALAVLSGCTTGTAAPAPPTATAPGSSSPDPVSSPVSSPPVQPPTSAAPASSSPPSSAPSAAARPSTTPTAPQPAAGTALALLESLPVQGRAPRTGYSRDRFGQAWLDVDRNGCDTRNDVLAAQLTGITFTNAAQCRVASGTLTDPYTATAVSFVRGQGTSELVQIDHVVALSDAWQKGAQQLSDAERAAFANDPLNLQATTRAANTQKRDGDAATWLPAATGYRCTYVAR